MICTIGTRVKLVNKSYRDSSSNPIWDGRYGKTNGSVVDINQNLPFPVTVNWDNGDHNCYQLSDLEEINGFDTLLVDAPTTATELLYRYPYYSYDYGMCIKLEKCPQKDKEEPKKTTMEKLNVFIKKLVDADTQLLLKYGYLNGDLMPTEKYKAYLNEQFYLEGMTKVVAKAKEDEAEAKAKETKESK